MLNPTKRYLKKSSSADSKPPEAIASQKVDQGTGGLYPYYDRDTCLLFLAAKGDCKTTFFEWSKADSTLYYIDTFTTATPIKGFSLFPKSAMDVTKHEVVRGVRLESSSAQYLSFTVPRKSDMFQEDLYPDTVAMDCPSLSVGEWVQEGVKRGRSTNSSSRMNILDPV